MSQPLQYRPRSGTGAILLAFIAFISLGLPDGLLGVAWPSIRANFSRSLDSLGILLISSMAGYLLSSFYGGHVSSRLGVGWLLALSCAATGGSLLGYTLVPSWWMMIPLAAAAGLGAGAIDAGINTYVASNFGEHLMQYLHASFGIGITLGPVIMTFGINYFSSWRWGYIVVGSAQLALALCFALTVSMWHMKHSPAEMESKKKLTDYRTPLSETLRHPEVWVSILMFFIYAGIEATLGNWAYTFLTLSRGTDPELAGFWVGSYWAVFTIGRIMAGISARRFTLHSLIRISIIAAFLGAVLMAWDPYNAGGLIGVVIIGFAIAPVFPGLVSLTERRVGPRYAANTIGMQISASGLGIAAIPGLTGVVAQRTTLEIIPFMLIFWAVLLFILFTISMRRGNTNK